MVCPKGLVYNKYLEHWSRKKMTEMWTRQTCNVDAIKNLTLGLTGKKVCIRWSTLLKNELDT